MCIGYSALRRSCSTTLVALTLLLLASASFGAHVQPLTCSFGSNWVQVVSFVTLIDEELARNGGTYTGLDARSAESQNHINALTVWAEQANAIGIQATSATYCVNLTFVNIGGTPDSSPTGFLRTTVGEWALSTTPVNHFFIAPFGSPMALPVFQELDVHQKIVLSPSASSPVLYQCSPETLAAQPECASKPATAKRFDRAFGMQPPATRTSIPFLNLAQLYGAKTVGYYVESSAFSKSLVDGARAAQDTYGIKEVAYAFVQLNSQGTAPAESIANATSALAAASPDIIIAGTTRDSCIGLTAALGDVKWVPKAALASLCASDRVAVANSPNTKYFTDYVEWDRRLTGYQYVDALYWPPTASETSPIQLYNAFTARIGASPSPATGVAIAAGRVIHELVLAMDGVDDDTATNADTFARTLSVNTVVGPILFSQWGQNGGREVSLIQLDRDFFDRVVYPLSSVTTQMTYPMPTFEERVSNLSYMSDKMDIAFVILATVGIVVSILLFGFVFKFRARKMLMAASPLFLMIMLVGTILMYLTIFAWVLESQTVACHVRFWLLGLGFVLTFGALFAKTFRVMRIFGSKSMTVFRITNFQLLVGLSVLVTIEVVLLAIWSGTSNPTSYTFVPDPDRPSKNEWRCRSKNNNKVMLGLLLAYNFGLAAASVWVSFKVWSIKAKMYNESRAIAFSMYNMLCFGILGVALQLSNVLTPRAMFAVRSTVIFLATFVTVCALFGPKVYHMLSTAGRDYATSTTVTTTAGTRSKDSAPNNGSANNGSIKSSSKDASMGASDNSDDIFFWRGKYDDMNTKYKKLRGEKKRLEKELQRFHEANF